MKTIINERLSRLRKSLIDHQLDTLMVLIEENRRYLSGFTGEDTYFDESAGALLITAERLILATDSRFELQAQNEAPHFETYCYKKGLAKELPGILHDLKTRRMGFESIRMSCSQYDKIQKALKSENLAVELVPADALVKTLRLKKDASEIETMKRALRIAESAFLEIKKTLVPGMTEKEIAWHLEQALHSHGAESLSFPIIAAAGPNSAMPHAIPEERPIKSGEPILFDWGAKVDGYCSDISRTLVIGRPDKTFNKIYQTVWDAQRKAIDAIKPGMKTKEVDAVARNHIEQMGFKDRFGHGLGHGVGMAVHEDPRLSPLSDSVLEEGMVVTVEPAIYIPEWGGIRLENMVVVTSDGAEILNELGLDDYECSIV